MGRPDKLTPERRTKIINAIRDGNYMEVAARYAGIDKSTLYRWLQEGREARCGKKKEFYDAVQVALAESEVMDVHIIGMAARDNKDWRAALARLERRYPQRWRPTTEVAHTGDRDKPVTVEQKIEVAEFNTDNLSVEELANIEELMLKGLIGGAREPDELSAVPKQD